MAYPEPIPPLTGKDAEEFLRRLAAFRLTETQKALYRGCLASYRRTAPE